MYCAPEKKWVISRTQDGDTTTALLQSEETCEEKQMPSSVSVWKGRQKDQWVDFEEVSVRDYVVSILLFYKIMIFNIFLTKLFFIA